MNRERYHDQLGARIRARRLRAGMSQQELAVLVGVRKQAVCNWEKGRHGPRVDAMKSLALALDTTVDELLPNGEST